MVGTRHGALPMRRIHPPEKVLAFGAALTVVGLVLAWFLDNPLTSGFIALGVATYLGVYTVGLKRRSESNIVIGGVARACPPPPGSPPAPGHPPPPPPPFPPLLFLWAPRPLLAPPSPPPGLLPPPH